MNIYIVKSGRMDSLTGWYWLNLKAFTDYDKAIEYKSYVESQIRPEDLGDKEDVEIEELTLE